MNNANSVSKKTGILALAVALLFGFSPFVLDSYAEAKSRPSIKEVRGRQVEEIKLPIKYEKYADKKVRIKLSRTNTFTGEKVTTSHNRKLDDEGKVTLRVDDLNPGTLYSFRVRIKRDNGSSYSDSSKKRHGSTKYIGQK